MRPRLGLVEFLNSRPIGYGLLAGRQRGLFEIVQGVPSALADALAAGEIDLALLPSVEYAIARAGGRAAAIVPGIAIASRGPSESVLLFSRVPAARIRSIALDHSSRTSAALMRLLLSHRLLPEGSALPAFVSMPPRLPAMLERCDAALMIGDAALFASRDHPSLVSTLHVHDLGSEWAEMTGLPFVFAFWAGPPRPDSGWTSACLQASLAEGLENLPRIAREAARGDPSLERRIQRYLASTMHYDLGEAEIEGLAHFYRLLAASRLIEKAPGELVFQGVERHAERPSPA